MTTNDMQVAWDREAKIKEDNAERMARLITIQHQYTAGVITLPEYFYRASEVMAEIEAYFEQEKRKEVVDILYAEKFGLVWERD